LLALAGHEQRENMSDNNISAGESLRYLARIFLGSSIGRKAVVGFSALGLAGFLMFHLVGNSFLLKGAAAFNTYAKLLHSLPFLLVIEVGLGAFFLLHVVLGGLVTWQNYCARPVGYQVRATAGSATWASRLMIYSGGTILVFIAYHLWTLNAGSLPNESPWLRVQSILTNPVSITIYAAGFLALGLHLFHGFSSLLVTFGLRHARHDAWVDVVCRAGALVLALGYASLAFYCFLK
jgi:succinate dehydrogenase / fumarate reductase cytochrome b subunit